MLRGNAEDLFLPDRKDIEFRHLARRIGYEPTQNQQEEDQLSIDFETFSAKIRQFVERHLGRDALPTPAAGSVVDLILNQAVSDELLARVMDQGGFLNHRRALVNIKSLAGSAEQQQEFSRLIVLSWDTLVTSPDPDMALNNWEQFVRRLPDPLEHFRQLLSQPKRISLLLSLFGVSQFLSDTLIQNPDFFAWITDPSIVGKARDQITMEQDLRVQAQESHSRLDWVNRLRLFRKREILRIGLRDLGLGVKLEEIMGEISFLARACCEVALDQCWKRVAPSGTDPSLVGPDPDHLVVCGFGKLGGWELNYSSDIDLVAIYQPRGESRTEEEELTYTKVVKSLVQDLTDFTQEGQAYRVDLRLRPYGVSGPLVSTLTSILDYYENHADLWEFQALIKLKPVAGNLSLGEIFLDRVRDPFIQKWDPPRVRSSIARMRDLALKEHTSRLGDRIDVKNSKGGIRDIEFRVQGLQLIHSAEYPQLLKGNTLRSLALLREQGIISESDLHQVSGDYRFLRRIEHYLQISEDRQLHTLPDSLQQREKLAWFLSDALAEVGKKPQGTARFRAEEFFATLQQVMIRVRTAYEEFLNPRS